MMSQPGYDEYIIHYLSIIELVGHSLLSVPRLQYHLNPPLKSFPLGVLLSSFNFPSFRLHLQKDYHADHEDQSFPELIKRKHENIDKP